MLEGAEPRHIIAGNGHVFFTTYGGYLAAVDTVNYALTAKTKVGSYPEGLAGYGNTIIVANSDYARGNGTISVVDLNTFRADTRTIQGIHNPQKVFIVDGNVYVLDWSYYEGEWPNSVEKGESALRYVTNMTSSKVADAYYASCSMASSTSSAILMVRPLTACATLRLTPLTVLLHRSTSLKACTALLASR